MNDSQYHQLADDLLNQIQDRVDEIDFDLDYETAGGIVEVIFPNGSKIIINKQAPLQQIWVATKFNGHHFEYNDGKWIDNRTGAELFELLNDAGSKQAGTAISFG